MISVSIEQAISERHYVLAEIGDTTVSGIIKEACPERLCIRSSDGVESFPYVEDVFSINGYITKLEITE